MKRFLILIFTCLIIAGFVMFLPGTAKASGAPSNTFFGVATVAKDDSWAVGESATSTGSRTLIEHLDDNAWHVVSSPSPSGATFAALSSVAVVSEHNVWAVGSFTPSSNFSQTLIEHWNGAQWQIVPSPSLQGSSDFLTGVAAISKQDVWAVGVNIDSSNAENTLIEHWNGQSWKIVPSPNAGPSFNLLNGVTAFSKNDVWAVGNFTDSNNLSQGLIEHWNGSTWEIIPSSAPAGTDLEGVVAISHQDAWAVGHFVDSNNNTEALTEHWNGQVWQVVANPNPVNAFLSGVTAVSHKDVWAVGFTGGLKGASTTLIEHWNGQVWQIVPSPNPAGSSSSVMYGVTARSHQDAWAVGGSAGNGSTTTLAEHWNGQSWSIVFSPTP